MPLTEREQDQLDSLLNGDTPAISAGDAEVVLRKLRDFIALDPSGAYRYWYHEVPRRILKFRDNHPGPLFREDIAKLGSYLREVRDAGALHVL